MRTELADVLDDGRIAIDVGRLLFDFSTDEQVEAIARELARSVTWCDAFCERLVAKVVDGCTEDGDWWPPGVTEPLRTKLLPLVDDAVAELVADLVNQRDHAHDMRDRWMRFAWDVAAAWDDHKRPSSRDVDYGRPVTLTREQAKDLVLKAIKSGEPPPRRGE